MDPLKIHRSWSNQRYTVYMGDEIVYVTTDEYKCDMFIAELKARIIMMRQELQQSEDESE